MTMHVYRYRYELNEADLRGVVPGSPSVGASTPAVTIDVTLDEEFKPDLDAAMTERNYVFQETDPS